MIYSSFVCCRVTVAAVFLLVFVLALLVLVVGAFFLRGGGRSWSG
jgi:hypothetical protein